MKGTKGFRHIAKKRFELFLDTQGYRKTAERFAVMDELFAYEGHIDADGLFLTMRNKNYSISRANKPIVGIWITKGVGAFYSRLHCAI